MVWLLFELYYLFDNTSILELHSCIWRVNSGINLFSLSIHIVSTLKQFCVVRHCVRQCVIACAWSVWLKSQVSGQFRCARYKCGISACKQSNQCCYDSFSTNLCCANDIVILGASELVTRWTRHTWRVHRRVIACLWRVHRVTSSLCDEFTVTSSLLWRVHFRDEFTVCRVHRVTTSPCDELHDWCLVLYSTLAVCVRQCVSCCCVLMSYTRKLMFGSFLRYYYTSGYTLWDKKKQDTLLMSIT